MNTAIESELAPLIGEALTSMWRILGLQVLEFGTQKPAANRKGEPITRADHLLRVSCSWRVIGRHGVVMGREDCEAAAAPFDLGGPEPQPRDLHPRGWFDGIAG